jgi:hypothetical protein
VWNRVDVATLSSVRWLAEPKLTEGERRLGGVPRLAEAGPVRGLLAA